jgi:Fe-S-cluster-containing dehydrogenase component
MKTTAKKVYVVSDLLCSGCRNCEMWCSFRLSQGQKFTPGKGRVNICSDAHGELNSPEVDCAEACELNDMGEPICVEMCPTGCLIFTDPPDLEAKRAEWEEARRAQPVFKLIVPWKYPYPWRALERDEL